MLHADHVRQHSRHTQSPGSLHPNDTGRSSRQTSRSSIRPGLTVPQEGGDRPILTRVRHGTIIYNNYRNITCYKCKQKGHTANRCKKVNSVDRRTDRKIICWGCGQEGHILKFCKNINQKPRPPLGHGRSFDHVRSNQQSEN